MADHTTVYELTLLLSTDAEEDVRERILADLETAIERGGGSVVTKSSWGRRGLAYPIERHDEAEVHLFELTGPANLLEEVGRTLRITDGVLRFRIIKAIPGGRLRPAAEPTRTAVAATANEDEGS